MMSLHVGNEFVNFRAYVLTKILVCAIYRIMGKT